MKLLRAGIVPRRNSSVEHLPENARKYVSFLENLLAVPLFISTGPDRVDTDRIDHPFDG